MSRLLSIVSLMVLLLPSLVKLGVVFHFQLNRTYIAEELCIRRDEPVPMCSGKCYLGDQLRQVDEQPDGRATLPLRHKVETACFLPQNFAHLSINIPVFESISAFAEDVSRYQLNLSGRLFRPPIFSIV